MTFMLRRLGFLGLMCVGMVGCGEATQEKVDDTKDKVSEQVKLQRDNLAKKIEDEIVDYLTCAGVARPSTINEVVGTLKDPDRLSLDELLMAPDHMGQLVGMAGVTFEAYVILARNLLLLSNDGLGSTLLEQGVDALSCGQEVALACTVGSAKTQAVCEQGAVMAVRTQYQGCMLRGDKHDGVVEVLRDAQDKTKATLKFEAFQLGELDRLSGALVVDVSASATAQALALASDGGLAMTSFGGHDGPYSCGQTKTLSRFEVAHNTTGVKLAFVGEKQTKEERYALETFGEEHLKWADDASCTCPGVGSGLKIGIPKPLGREDEVATMSLKFVQGSGACPAVQVSLPDWPSSCSLLESPFKDCGRGAAEKVLKPLLQSLCQPL